MRLICLVLAYVMAGSVLFYLARPIIPDALGSFAAAAVMLIATTLGLSHDRRKARRELRKL